MADASSESSDSDLEMIRAVDELDEQDLKRQRIAINILLTQAARPGPKGPKRRPRKFSWDDHCSRMNEREFKHRYRVPEDAFEELFEMVRSELSATDIAQAERSHDGEWCAR
jgi:hypothetical protein